MVEVRSEADILRTLDADGKLDGLPFMPEMPASAASGIGSGRALHKACDTVDWQQYRRMESAVHLEELRCDGSAHGGCQAGCLLYWKEAWLVRLEPQEGAAAAELNPTETAARALMAPGLPRRSFSARPRSERTTRRPPVLLSGDRASESDRGLLPWWEPNQYVEDITSGNSTVPRVIRALLIGLFNRFQQANARFLPASASSEVQALPIHRGKGHKREHTFWVAWLTAWRDRGGEEQGRDLCDVGQERRDARASVR